MHRQSFGDTQGVLSQKTFEMRIDRRRVSHEKQGLTGDVLE